MPIALRYILNTFFYIVYSFIWMLISGISFWKYNEYYWKAIPLNWDIIYMKIAVAICFIILVITVIFRKYFYISSPEKRNN